MNLWNDPFSGGLRPLSDLPGSQAVSRQAGFIRIVKVQHPGSVLGLNPKAWPHWLVLFTDLIGPVGTEVYHSLSPCAGLHRRPALHVLGYSGHVGGLRHALCQCLQR